MYIHKRKITVNKKGNKTTIIVEDSTGQQKTYIYQYIKDVCIYHIETYAIYIFVSLEFLYLHGTIDLIHKLIKYMFEDFFLITFLNYGGS